MGKQYFIFWRRALILLIAMAVGSGALSRAQSRGPAQQTNYVIVVIVGHVEVARAGSQTFDLARTNSPLFVGDRVRIGPESELTIRRTDQSVYRFDEKTEFEVLAPKNAAAISPTVRLLSGVLYFFHRGKPGVLDVLTRMASAAVRGTEFELRVQEDGTTIVTVIDGLVDLSNDVNTAAVASGQQGIAEAGKAPVVRAAIDAINVIRWTLYYPGILDVDEIPFSDEEKTALSASLEAYRAGDLVRAVSEYPKGRAANSEAEKIYRAGLFLAVGQVDDAELLLRGMNSRLAGALQTLVAAVKLAPSQTNVAPELASEWLAESYRLQARRELEGALQAARRAVGKSPRFGFAWARVAELEFSFGRIDLAQKAVMKALELSPRNAQALALNGFLFAARNKMESAMQAFDQAIALDGRLGNAWLGRGLVKIRKGDRDAGREDLVTAAAMEPQRAFLRSYLGKAWADAREGKLAEHELELAQQLDPRDPTAWLYSALLEQQNNRVNHAVRDLEHAQELGGNRGVYRSRDMLDEDRAVRSANLANIYRDGGMTDWSIREAGRAVSADYANYSAHLFLANSYDQLRDPNRINLRYETPAESEYMIANLLAPAGAGTLSRSVSQGEYSRLFEGNRFGVASTTEYLSRGAWYENGAQFGVIDNTAYSIEGIYRYDPGQRVNNDFEERDLRVLAKQQLTYKDSVFVLASHKEASGGDVLQYYDPNMANPGVRTRQRQEPIVTVGYHHEWNPGSHTLLLACRLDDTFWVQNPTQQLFGVLPYADGSLFYVEPIFARQDYRSALEIYSGEAQQIWQTHSHITTVGSRIQRGDFKTFNLQSDFGPASGYVSGYVPFGRTYQAEFTTPFERFSVYGYHSWQIADAIQVVGGISYDRIIHPENFRASPISNVADTTDQVSPKAGFVWTPLEDTTIRGAYTRSLSGASIDQSLTIEPSQVAGINQSFRSLMPESVGGSDIAARFETFGLSAQKKFDWGMYVSIAGELLYSDNDRTIGVLTVNDPSNQARPGGMREEIAYRERSASISIDQLIGRDWSIGGRYRLVNSRLDVFFPEVAPVATLLGGFETRSSVQSTLHQVDAHANFNHPSGVFALGQALWSSQSNSGYSAEIPGDSFWQLNAFVGYRFLQRRAEVVVGLLNLTDEDYKLNPLTPYLELPRERTVVVRARLNF
jgi:Tfp pilus assembly protein PilF